MNEKQNDFSKWLDTFLQEKEFSLEDSFIFDDVTGIAHHMSYAVVVEAIHTSPSWEQEQIKNMLVHIDFKNGDVLDYLRHLGKAMVNMQVQRK